MTQAVDELVGRAAATASNVPTAVNLAPVTNPHVFAATIPTRSPVKLPGPMLTAT